MSVLSWLSVRPSSLPCSRCLPEPGKAIPREQELCACSPASSTHAAPGAVPMHPGAQHPCAPQAAPLQSHEQQPCAPTSRMHAAQQAAPMQLSIPSCMAQHTARAPARRTHTCLCPVLAHLPAAPLAQGCSCVAPNAPASLLLLQHSHSNCPSNTHSTLATPPEPQQHPQCPSTVPQMHLLQCSSSLCNTPASPQILQHLP